MTQRVCLLLLFAGTAFARNEWFRGLDLEPSLNDASLVMAARVVDVSDTRMILGGKMETTLREYKFSPSLVLKGVFSRESLSLTSQDLGLAPLGDMAPVERGQFRLLILGRSNRGYAVFRTRSPVEQIMPLLNSPSDELVATVKILLGVNATTDRLERVRMLQAGLQAQQGVAAVPLLISLERRRLLAAQTPGIVDPISRHFRAAEPALREQAATTLQSILDADYLDQAIMRQQAVSALATSLSGAGPNIGFRVAAFEAIGAAGRAALDNVGARTLLGTATRASFAEEAARYHAVGQLHMPSQENELLAALQQLPLDAEAAAQSEAERALIKLNPMGIKVVAARLQRKFDAGLPVAIEIEALGDAPAAMAVPLLVQVSNQPLEHAERYAWAMVCHKIPDDRLVPPLAEMLAPNEPDIRRASVEALFKINSDAAANALEPHLAEEPSLAAKLEMAEFLGRHGIRAGYPFVLEHMSESNLRDRAVTALAAIREPRTAGELRHILDTSNDVDWNSAAIEALGKLGATDLNARFLTIAQEARNPLAPAAIQALGDLHQNAVLPIVRAGLGSRRPEVVAASARAAAQLQNLPADVRDQLAEILSDPAASVEARSAALDALLTLQDSRLDRALARAVRDAGLERDPDVLLVKIEKVIVERKIRIAAL